LKIIKLFLKKRVLKTLKKKIDKKKKEKKMRGGYPQRPLGVAEPPHGP